MKALKLFAVLLIFLLGSWSSAIPTCAKLLVGEYRTEFELKLFLQGSNFASEYRGYAPTEREIYEYGRKSELSLSYPLSSLRQVVLDSLERYYLPGILTQEQKIRINALGTTTLNQENFEFSLRPLSSKAEHYHDQGRYDKGFVKWAHVENNDLPDGYLPSSVELETSYSTASGEYLNGHLMQRTSAYGYDSINIRYLVAHLEEKSVYYDSPNGDFEKLGFAIRVKMWSDPKAGSSSPLARQLMIKQTVGKEGPFLHRKEYSISIDPSASDAEVDQKVRKFMNEKFEQRVSQKTLNMVSRHRQVDAERYGVPLLLNNNGKSIRVGFFSFDKYTFDDLQNPSNSKPWYKRDLVFEVESEIFPEFKDLISQPQNMLAYKRFVADFMTKFNAKPTDLHKHQVNDYQQLIESNRDTP